MAIDTSMIVALENYQYNDNTTVEVTTNDSTLPYYITITKAFCKLNFSYSHEDGEELKYYQFFLYNKDNDLLGISKKIYGIPESGITYGVENYNNLQAYKLELHCVTQSNNKGIATVYLNIDYEQDNIYADISFVVDKQFAENNISISLVQLNGEGENYTYDAENNSEYVIIPDDGYVTFTDSYQVISNNFLCRMWCKNLSKNVSIMTINTSNNSGRIEVFFDGKNFIAKKHSCGLVSLYTTCIKNIDEDGNEADITSELPIDTNIYFALGYYNGRIEMYARVIS